MQRAFGAGLTASQRFQRGLEPVARGARNVLLGLGALSVATGKLAHDFDLTSSRMVGLAGVAEGQVESWKDSLLEMAPIVGKVPKELSEALYFVASSGVDASKALGIVEKAARASTAGLGETTVVADAVTSAMNAYEQSNLSAAAATDILVATVREGKGEASDIAPVLGNVVPIASQLGVEFSEVGASIAAMTRLGFDAATAATNLSGVFNALLKPAKDSREALKDIGTSAGEVREMLGEKGLLPTLQFLSEAFEGNEAALARVFRDVRGFRGVLTLVGKAGEGTAGVFERMADSTGALDHAFASVDDDALAMSQAWAQLQADGIRLGRAIVPIGADIASALADAAHFAGEHETATKAAAVAVGGFAAAIVTANAALRIYNSQLIAATLGKAGLLRLAGVAGPIGLLGAAVIGVGLGLRALRDDTTESEDAMREATDAAHAYRQALDGLESATNQEADAALRAERAELDVARARQTRAQALKESGRGTLAYRDANLRLREAVRSLSLAEADLNQKEQDVRTGQQRVGITARQVRGDLLNMAASTKDVRDVMGETTPEMLGGAAAFRRWNREIDADAAARYGKQVANLAGELGGAQTRAGRAALAVLALTQRVNRVPTKREIEFALKTAEAYAQLAQIHDRINDPVYMPVILRPSGTTGVQARQHGGPVNAGEAYVVGEQRPELLVMGRRGGHVYPTVGRGMRAAAASSSLRGLAVEGRIDADGYLRGIVVDELHGAARRFRARERMGA